MSNLLNLPRVLVAALLVLPLLTASSVSSGGVGTIAVAATTAKPTFVVDGRVAESLTLTVDQLRNCPIQRQRVRFAAGGGQEIRRYQGALLAFEEDGRALDRPRLVVPGDGHGGRYVTEVSSVSLFRVAT